MTIQEYAINQAFPEHDQRAIRLLLLNTGNPELALQILLNVHRSDWDQRPTNRIDEKGNNLRVTAYDPWGDRVHYEYDEISVRWGKTAETPRNETHWEQNDTYSVKIEYPKVSTSAMSLERWNDLSHVPKIVEDTTFIH